MMCAFLLLLVVARAAAGAGEVPTSRGPAVGELKAADVAVRLDDVEKKLVELRADAAAGGAESGIPAKLTAEREAIDALGTTTRNTLDGQPTLMDLQELDRQWVAVVSRLNGWARTLAGHIQALQRNLAQAHDLHAVWRDIARAMKAQEAPPALLTRVHATLSEATAIQTLAATRLAVLLDLESSVARETARAEGLAGEIRRARQDLRGRLLFRDAPTLVGAWLAPGAGDVIERGQATMREDVRVLAEYLQRRAGLIPTWVVLLVVAMLAGAVFRRRSRHW